MAVDNIPAAALNAAATNVTRAPAPKLSTADAAAAPQAVQRSAPEPSEEQVRRVTDEPSAPAREIPVRRPRIRVSEETKRFITQIVDENQEVVRQIPPEELIEFSARFRRLQGILFDERV
jgi:uncharacterized FlaG/YvyC family protein